MSVIAINMPGESFQMIHESIYVTARAKVLRICCGSRDGASQPGVDSYHHFISIRGLKWTRRPAATNQKSCASAGASGLPDPYQGFAAHSGLQFSAAPRLEEPVFPSGILYLQIQ
jgi:hypothetical protein